MIVTLALLVLAPIHRAPPAGATEPTTRHQAARDQASDDPFVIGSLAPETGDGSAVLASLRTPVQLAVDEINAAGGIHNAPVRLATADEGSDPAVANRGLEHLLTVEHVDAVVGPTGSRAATALAGPIGDAPVVACSPSATAVPFDASASQGYLFRVAPSDRLQGLALGRLLTARGHRTIAVLRRDDAYGVTLAKPLKQAARAAGARIALEATYDPDAPGDAALAARARTVVQAHPDAVVILGQADDGARALRALLAEGLDPATARFGTDAMQSTTFAATVDANPARAAGLAGVAPAPDPAPGPAGIDSPFPATLASHGVEPVFSAQAYDCTILAALAAVRARSDAPAALRRSFVANLRGTHDCNTFADCRALLERGRSIHWRGASSRFERYRATEPGSGTYDVWSYDEGGAVVTRPPTEQLHVP